MWGQVGTLNLRYSNLRYRKLLVSNLEGMRDTLGGMPTDRPIYVTVYIVFPNIYTTCGQTCGQDGYNLGIVGERLPRVIVGLVASCVGVSVFPTV